MITGLLCHVQGDELIDHCQKRTAYHKQRWDEYQVAYKTYQQAKMDNMKATGVPDDSSDSTPANIKGAVREDQVVAKVRKHKCAYEYFRFMAAHLSRTEVYMLRMDELVQLDLVEAKHIWS
jgi:hypothetical protein